ncbi:hypothetical protein BOW53_06065 [Solemya pervernicosa gill symbiont]|uniref:Probable nicotinate-nucleotide adenylyltransferase n=2 Tax=Gammaproteobacteria incertae sedis TaxID=118884 RepID=A0A1T2L710_9GAMM|nr:nicotinate-nucleotide adenylyltransferase [Candidatus Reidiella endopervernicosa]OOZ40898.1 hypothetical protein BOW53_06065 [Solemya pervernicosa gill symbiont]QKQ26126.1 nicotinate-nucleotide adenylyltransferase [Candidatus Reidiella endopervernicosa]
MKAIGIFGGTFDPVHIGHLRPALELKTSLGLAEVRMVPCRIPPHRNSPVVKAEQRVLMLQAALEGVGELSLDLREMEREGPSYMADTLTSLRCEMPEQPLCLIIGMDALLGLPSWHRWTELIELAHLVVMARPGYELPNEGVVAELVAAHRLSSADELHGRPAGGIWFSEVSQLDVSATALRALIAKGRTIRYLTPDAVCEVIEREGLYQIN